MSTLKVRILRGYYHSRLFNLLSWKLYSTFGEHRFDWLKTATEYYYNSNLTAVCLFTYLSGTSFNIHRSMCPKDNNQECPHFSIGDRRQCMVQWWPRILTRASNLQRNCVCGICQPVLQFDEFEWSKVYWNLQWGWKHCEVYYLESGHTVPAGAGRSILWQVCIYLLNPPKGESW